MRKICFLILALLVSMSMSARDEFPLPDSFGKHIYELFMNRGMIEKSPSYVELEEFNRVMVAYFDERTGHNHSEEEIASELSMMHGSIASDWKWLLQSSNYHEIDKGNFDFKDVVFSINTDIGKEYLDYKYRILDIHLRLEMKSDPERSYSILLLVATDGERYYIVRVRDYVSLKNLHYSMVTTERLELDLSETEKLSANFNKDYVAPNIDYSTKIYLGKEEDRRNLDYLRTGEYLKAEDGILSYEDYMKVGGNKFIGNVEKQLFENELPNGRMIEAGDYLKDPRKLYGKFYNDNRRLLQEKLEIAFENKEDIATMTPIRLTTKLSNYKYLFPAFVGINDWDYGGYAPITQTTTMLFNIDGLGMEALFHSVFYEGTWILHSVDLYEGGPISEVERNLKPIEYFLSKAN